MNTPYQKGSQTSQDSAEMLDSTGAAEKYKDFITGRLKALGDNGSTVAEMTAELRADGNTFIHNGTVAGIFRSLEKDFLVKKTDQTRINPESNRQVTVYITHDGTPYPLAQTKAEMIYDDVEICHNFVSTLVNMNLINSPLFSKRAPEIRDKLNAVMKVLRS